MVVMQVELMVELPPPLRVLLLFLCPAAAAAALLHGLGAGEAPIKASRLQVFLVSDRHDLQGGEGRGEEVSPPAPVGWHILLCE